MKVKDSYNSIFKDVNKILVVMAHPDDAEILCGGLIIRAIKDGKNVRLVVMTDGGKGYQDREDITEKEFGALRVKEQERGASKMGISTEQNFNFGILDGEVENSLENIERLVYHIREFKPELVIAHNWDEKVVMVDEGYGWVNHRDHRFAAEVTMDAVYPYCRDRGFFPDHFTKHNLSPHKVTKVLFTDVYGGENLHHFDITKYVELKSEALSEHKEAIPADQVKGYIDDYKLDDETYFEKLKYLELY